MLPWMLWNTLWQSNMAIEKSPSNSIVFPLKNAFWFPEGSPTCSFEGSSLTKTVRSSPGEEWFLRSENQKENPRVLRLFGVCGAVGWLSWLLVSLELYVGNLQVLWWLLGFWTAFGGCMLATYRSYAGCWTAFGAVCWQPTGLMVAAGPPLGLYVGNLQVLWWLLDRLWGCVLATYSSLGGCWTAFGAVCWQPTGLMLVAGFLEGCMLATYRSYGGCWVTFVCWHPTGLMVVAGPPLGPVCWQPTRLIGVCWTIAAIRWQPTGLMLVAELLLGLYVGNLQVLWWLLDRFGAVCWQPTGLMVVAGPPLGLYAGNLHVLCWLLDRLWGCMLATYKSYAGCWTAFGAVCWQPTSLMVVAEFLDRLWGCMLATYRSYGGCWTAFGAVCWQPTGRMVAAGPPLRLYVGNLQVLCWLLGCWTAFGAVCWQPTGLMVVAAPPLGLYVGNLQVLWWLLDRLWGLYVRSYGGCWTAFGAACWQPTRLWVVAGPPLGLYVGNLQVLWWLLDRLWGCTLATYRSYGGCWTAFGAVCWQPTGLMVVAGPPLGLYVGNLQALWNLLDRLWGCMLATYRSYGGCWTAFGAVCWQPTGLMVVAGPPLGLYVGNLQVLWWLLDRLWGCMLATYRSCGGCWAAFGAVCWQPTGLMVAAGPPLGLYVGNLQVLCWLLDRRWGCMLATYRSYGGCWTAFGAVCWQPTGLMMVAGPPLGLYVGNLQVLWWLLDRLWGCMLATYRSYGGCWTAFGAVCWQPTGLMMVAGPPLGLYVGNLQVLWWLLDRLWGCMLATYRSYGGCWTAFGAVCWQPTGLMVVAGPPLGLHVGNLQVLWWLLDRLWGCMLATYRSYAGCWAAFGAVCWQPTGLMVVAAPPLGLYVGNLQVLCWLLDRLWGCMLATYRSYGGCWTAFGGVCWQPTGLMGVAGRGVEL